MKKIFLQTTIIVIFFGCGSTENKKKSEDQIAREQRKVQDSIIESNLTNKYKGIELINFYEGENKYSIDYQMDGSEKHYLISPELLDIYKSDSLIYAKYFLSSYPNDFIFILKVDTVNFSLDSIKENTNPDFLVAKARYVKLVDLKFKSEAEIQSETEITTETEIQKGETIILKGELIELIKNKD